MSRLKHRCQSLPLCHCEWLRLVRVLKKQFDQLEMMMKKPRRSAVQYKKICRLTAAMRRTIRLMQGDAPKPTPGLEGMFKMAEIVCRPLRH